MRAGRGDPAGADHLHARTDEADHVVDRVAALDMAAGRVDDDADVAVAFHRISEELRADALGHLHIDFAEDQHGARLEQRVGDRRALRLGGVLLFFLFVVVFVEQAQGGCSGEGMIQSPY